MFKHDCKECEYLGSFEFHDLYYCTKGDPTIIARYGHNPEEYMSGIEFASGWDILNVAKAFAMPKTISKKWKKSTQSAFYANIDMLHKHTNKFDRILGAVFYWIYAFTGVSVILLVLLDAIGVFD